MGPNNITRAIIDATVDRGIREIEGDPRRSIRKLTDMGKQFSRGRFLQELYEIFQDLLRNEDNLYYTAIENLLRNTNRKAIKDLGINIGYDSFTYGGKVIRSMSKKKGFQIPWTLLLRMNTSIPGSMSPSEIDMCVRQGRPLGIYSYIIRIAGPLDHLEELMAIVKSYKDCAFILMLPDRELTPAQISAITPCTNAMTMFHSSGSNTGGNVKVLKKQKAWYGIYEYYSNSDYTAWSTGSRLGNLSLYDSSFFISVADDECDPSTVKAIGEVARRERMNPSLPVLFFDLYEDALQIDKIISSDAEYTEPCYLEITETGDIRTQNGPLTEYHRVISLEQVLTLALPLPQ